MALGVILACLLALGVAGFGQQRWIIKNGYLKYKQSPQYCSGLREGIVKNGVDIILWHCTKKAQHKFKVSGKYIQYEADPSYCLSVREGKAGDGSDIILWKCDDAPAFHWDVDGEFIKYKAKPHFVMSVRQDNAMDGADVILWEAASMHDKWIFDGKAIKMSSDQSMCLGLSHKPGDGTNVIVSRCGIMTIMSRWVRDGKFIKWDSDPRLCLSIREGRIMDGQDIILWTCNDSPEFHWEVSGSYIQHAANQDYCLSTREASGRRDQAKAMLWSCKAMEPLGLPVSADQRQQAMASENTWLIQGSFLKSALDDKYCASVRQGEVTDGADIIMWHCRDTHEFKWTVEGNQIKLVSNPNYCMGVREGKAGDGSDVILWSCNSDHAFRWKVDGSSIVYKRDPRYFMTVRQGRIGDGANVILWSGYINPFLFTFDGHLIKPKADPSKCVSVRENKVGDGSDIILWSCSNIFEQVSQFLNQSNKVEKDGFRWMVSHEHIVLDHGTNNHCLSVREGNAQDGQDIILWTCGDGYADRWVIDGERIRYKGNQNYCMSVREGRIGDGSDIILWACDELYDLDDEL